MGIIIGLAIAFICILGSFVAMGGHITVLIQPWEFVIIFGSAFGVFLVANPFSLVKDTVKSTIEAMKDDTPKQKDYLDILGLLYALMREMRTKPRSEVEPHIDSPETSPIFQQYPSVLGKAAITRFICDYCRLMIFGSARPFEIEALMDEEIQTVSAEALKPYKAMQNIADALPALGICAAVLGVIKAMGVLNESPEVLGHLIGAALVGTFAGIFGCYGVAGPIANNIKSIRSSQMRVYAVIKQTLLAYMHGSTPQIALEYGRKTIAAKNRPTIDVMEQEAIAGQGSSEKTTEAV